MSRVPAADGTERVVLQGLAALRWAAWTWMAAVAALSRGNLARPGLAAVLVGAALAGTAAGTALLRRRPAALFSVLHRVDEARLERLLAEHDPFGAGV